MICLKYIIVSWSTTCLNIVYILEKKKEIIVYKHGIKKKTINRVIRQKKNRSKLRALQLLLYWWTSSNQYAQHNYFSILMDWDNVFNRAWRELLTPDTRQTSLKGISTKYIRLIAIRKTEKCTKNDKLWYEKNIEV